MSALRNFTLVAIAAAALAGSAQAQAHPMGGHDRGEMMEHFDKLNLTEAQKAQIKAIHEKYQAQLKANREQANTYKEAARAARQKGDTAAFRANLEKAHQLTTALHEQAMNEVRAVLTPAQRAQADSMMAMHERRDAMRGRAGMFEGLNLTDAQKTQIKEIRTKYQDQAKTSREQELTEIRAVLTAEQRAKLDSAIARRKLNAGDRGTGPGPWKKGDN